MRADKREEEDAEDSLEIEDNEDDKDVERKNANRKGMTYDTGRTAAVPASPTKLSMDKTSMFGRASVMSSARKVGAVYIDTAYKIAKGQVQRMSKYLRLHSVITHDIII